MAPERAPLIAYDREAGDLVDLGLLALAVGGALLALLVGWWPLAVLASAPSLAADAMRAERPPRLRRIARRILFDLPGRSLVRTGIVVAVLAALAEREGPVALAALLAGAMVLHDAQLTYATLGERVVDAESTRILWRNLAVRDALAGPAPLPDALGRLDGLRVVIASEAFLLIGGLLGGLGVVGAAVTGAALTVAICVVVVVLAWRAWSTRTVVLRDTDSAVEAAVADLAPEVAFYFSSPASGTYALTVWVDVINAIERPILVIVREAVHLPALDRIAKPLVVAPSVADLERVVPESLRVVLYPTNVVRNNEMIRIRGPLHSFIGHGDSDKVGSFSPLNRMYDEIWVAGQAAVDRYGAVDEGIDLKALRAVGRPQLAEIRRAAPKAADDGRLTVLYAPTWEGFFDEADYSSVAAMGERIAQTVLASGARLLFKPHPLTGHRLPAAGQARRAIEEAIARAGNGSVVVANSPNALYESFNAADLLISDISSVITDFLASRKPYAVTNRRDVPEAEFRETYPSAGAAELLGSDLTALPAALAAAAGDDPRRQARTTLARHLLGDQTDPLAAFLGEVDEFVARSERRATRRGAHPAEAAA